MHDTKDILKLSSFWLKNKVFLDLFQLKQFQDLFPKKQYLNFGILVFSTNLCPIKTDLSGNTVWPQASGFQKLAKMDHFFAFLINFCPLKM